MKYAKIAVFLFIVLFFIGVCFYFSREDGKTNKNVNSVLIESQNDLEKTEKQLESTEESKTIAIEETESTTVIREDDYSLGDNDCMNISITKKGEKEFLYISADIANEEKASLAYIYLYSVLSDSDLQTTDYGIAITSNSGMVSLIAGAPMGTNKDGSAVLSIPDWVIQDTESCTLSIEEQAETVDKIKECLTDFTDKEKRNGEEHEWF